MATKETEPVDEQVAAKAVDDKNDDDKERLETTEAKEVVSDVDSTKKYTSHLHNKEALPFWLRWGILFFLVGTFILLVNADIGSGVTAEMVMVREGEIIQNTEILNVSVLSSVGKLWDAKSYPLAILIAITSIGWPYIKLALATYAWVSPYINPRRREFLIEVIDALGKWSFVDIFVLVEIMVAFRSTIPLIAGLVELEIVIVAQWGFYGFVIATILSLLSTHIILHYHRKVHYHKEGTEEAANTPVDNDEDNGAEKCGMKDLGNLSTSFIVLAVGSLVFSFIFYLVGVLTESFEVTNTRGEESESTSYSIASIGMEIPEAYVDTSHAGTRFIQFMWFLLGVAAPLLCSVLFIILYAAPKLSKKSMEYIFNMAEISFAWSCAEVLLLSTIFAVLQMPIFGDGLIESDCAQCFVVSTKILPEFSLLCIGTVLNVGVNVWLYRKAHRIIYLQA